MSLFRQFGVLSHIGTITLMSLLVLPAMIGTLVDETSLTEVQAGWSASLNFLGGAVIAGLMALRMHHLDLRKISMFGFLLAATGDVLAGFSTHHATLFMLIRFLTGVGAGIAYTSVLAAFARLPQVDRGYAVFVTLQFVVSGLGLFLLPVFSETLGAKGMFISLALLDVLGFSLCAHLPGKAVQLRSGEIRTSELPVLFAGATVLGAVGFLIFEAAFTAEFTFVERMGVSLAFTDPQIGTSMLVASLAGIPGAFSIVLLGGRIGRFNGLVFGIAASVSGLVIMISAQSYAAYVIGSILISFAWAFCLPFIQGLLATLDPKGTAVAAGSASSTIGGAIGPGLAAMVIAGGVYQHVFMFAIGMLCVALACFYLSGRLSARTTTERMYRV